MGYYFPFLQIIPYYFLKALHLNQDMSHHTFASKRDKHGSRRSSMTAMTAKKERRAPQKVYN